MCIGYTKSVASISNHVKMGSVTCLFWLPLLKNRGSQNSSEQSCDCLLFHSITVPKIRSTPNSKWSSLRLCIKEWQPCTHGSLRPAQREPWVRGCIESYCTLLYYFSLSNARRVYWSRGECWHLIIYLFEIFPSIRPIANLEIAFCMCLKLYTGLEVEK